jgi:hypothetical protein
MPKTRTRTRASHPIKGDVALIDKHGEPGGETIEDAVEPENMTFADWCNEAEPYYIDRASKPGTFTSWSAIKDAPEQVRNPRSPNWPGMYMHRFHDRGYVVYALDEHGHEMFTPSEKPETGGSIVRVWVGVEAKRRAALTGAAS